MDSEDSNFPDTTFSGLVNQSTGLLSKAAETGLDLLAMKLAGGKTVGSVAPTGQTNPETLVSERTAAQASVSTLSTYLPYILGGGALLLGIIAVVSLSRK